MTTTSVTQRSGRLVLASLAVLLVLGLCAAASFVAGSRVKLVFPGFAGSSKISAQVLRVEPAGDGLMRVAIRVNEGPTGSQLAGYYAEVNGRRFSCEVSESESNLLLCVGPAFASGSTVELRLYTPKDEVVFGTTIALVPMVASEAQVKGSTGAGSAGTANDGSTFGILDLLTIALNGNIHSSGGLTVNANADVNADVQPMPASSCLLGLICLEADVNVSTR